MSIQYKNQKRKENTNGFIIKYLLQNRVDQKGDTLTTFKYSFKPRCTKYKKWAN